MLIQTTTGHPALLVIVICRNGDEVGTGFTPEVACTVSSGAMKLGSLRRLC